MTMEQRIEVIEALDIPLTHRFALLTMAVMEHYLSQFGCDACTARMTADMDEQIANAEGAYR